MHPIQVQSYALALVADRAHLRITAASANAERMCGRTPESLIGSELSELFAEQVVDDIRDLLSDTEPAVVPIPVEHLRQWPVGKPYQVIAYTYAEEVVVEVEPKRKWPNAGDYSARLSAFTDVLESSPTMEVLLERLCDGLRYHFDFDRVILLRFGARYESVVIQESVNDKLPPFLHLQFKAEDVPPSTHYNQLTNPVHNYTETSDGLVEIVGEHGPGARELLQRFVASRGPNVNFSKFLRDNELRTITYLSIVIDGVLWGSLYMHSVVPHYLDYQMRAFLRIVGRITQQKVAYHLSNRASRLLRQANSMRDRLQENIIKADSLIQGLIGSEITLLNLIEGTHGAAICSEEHLTVFGTAPTEVQISQTKKWLRERGEDEVVFHTDQLAEVFPQAPDFADVAAGILYLPLDIDANQWIMWFKPEVSQTVTFGSQAEQQPATGSDRRFEAVEVSVSGRSTPWQPDQIGQAEALQVFIQDVVMQRYARSNRRANLLREAYADLEAFSYTVGHDLRAPLRGMASFAEVLREDFGDKLGSDGLAHVEVIERNADRMQQFMNDLLTVSRVDRNKIIVNEHAVKDLVGRVLADRQTTEERHYTCVIQPDMPTIYGDHNHLVTVFTNLVSNAIKYSARREHPHMEIGFSGDFREGHPVFFVSDNGIGIPADQRGRIFDLFSRANNVGEFEGTGIGLALVKRIIGIHEGEIWIDDDYTEGTRFLFYTGVSI